MRHVLSVASALSVAVLCAAVSAQTLAPHQQAALDAVLAGVEPAQRAAARAQLEPMLALMDPAMIEIMLASMAADAGDTAPTPEAVDTVASPEDLAFNRTQYEPVIRGVWQAQRAFDDFVAARLDSACGPDGRFAVFGSAWRFEVRPPAPNWPRASNSADLDVQIIGMSYAPQDGRYEFDFSAVKQEFDRNAVEAAVATACRDYVAIGEAFMSDARNRISDDRLDEGDAIERAANGRLGPVRETLEAALAAHAPAGDGALFRALIEGQPAR